MAYVNCPAGCGKKYISLECAELHADEAHPDWRAPKVRKARGWATPYGFIDFSDTVTYEVALDTSKSIHERFKRKL